MIGDVLAMQFTADKRESELKRRGNAWRHLKSVTTRVGKAGKVLKKAKVTLPHAPFHLTAPEKEQVEECIHSFKMPSGWGQRLPKPFTSVNVCKGTHDALHCIPPFRH